MNTAQQIKQRLFASDLAACIALADARKAENVARRASAQGDAELCAALLAIAQRRGESEINWPEYFRNADM